MRELMLYLVKHERQIHYPLHDVRGAADAATWRLSLKQLYAKLAGGGSIQFDCSQSSTQLFKWLNLKDPNGLDYRYPGYTGTMLEHLRHYSNPEDAYVGALCVFGPGTGHHVSVVYEHGADPLLWSHGREGGPELVRLSNQRTYQPTPVTFLNVSRL